MAAGSAQGASMRLGLWLIAFALAAGSPARAETLDGLWNLTLGAVERDDDCTLDAKSTTQILAEDYGLRFTYTYFRFTGSGDTITASRPYELYDMKRWTRPPPEPVLAQIRGLQLESTFAGTLSAAGATLTGVERLHCFRWDGDKLIATHVLERSITGHRVKAQLHVRTFPAGTERVVQGRGFRLRLTLSEPISGQGLWAYRVLGDTSLGVLLSPTDDPLQLETRQLYVIGPPPPEVDETQLEDAALRGNFYAAPGDRLLFEAAGGATAEILVGK